MSENSPKSRRAEYLANNLKRREDGARERRHQKQEKSLLWNRPFGENPERQAAYPVIAATLQAAAFEPPTFEALMVTEVSELKDNISQPITSLQKLLYRVAEILYRTPKETLADVERINNLQLDRINTLFNGLIFEERQGSSPPTFLALQEMYVAASYAKSHGIDRKSPEAIAWTQKTMITIFEAMVVTLNQHAFQDKEIHQGNRGEGRHP